MAQSIDDLSIQISATASGALKTIGALTKKVTSLSTAISQIDVSNLTALSGALNGVGQGMANINANNAVSTIKSTAQSLNAVGQSSQNISKTTSAMQNLSQTVTSATSNIVNFKNNTNLTEGVSEGVKQTVDDFKRLYPVITESTGQISLLKRSLASLKIIIPTKGFEEVQKKIDKVKEKYNDLRESMVKSANKDTNYIGSNSYQKDEAKLQGLRNEYNKLILKQEELSRNGGFKANPQAFNNMKKSIQDVRTSLGKLWNQLKSVGGLIGSVFSKGVSAVKKLASALGTVAHSTIGSKKGMMDLSKALDKTFKKMVRLWKMLRLMITRKILQAIIKNAITGFNNMTQYSSRFNASVSLLWNSLRQLGNAVGSAVAPLLNAFAPALNQIIQLIIQAVNWINQLLSAFTGASTWAKAKVLTDSYAESLDKTAKSAKKANKQLQSFDALNNLTSKEDAGGGTSPMDMFEDVEVDNKFKDIADWLKQMWEIGDFYDLGKKLGEKLKKFLDSIPWGQIRKTANKLGKALATFINGFVEVEGLGVSIGKTFAQALNTIFEFVNGFVHALNWDSIGKFIADVFNGFFAFIDWKLIKDTVITGIKGVAKAINAFIEQFDWNNISKTIANALNIIVEALYNFVNDVRWGELGDKLGEQFFLLIHKIKWEEIGKTIGAIINKAMEFLGNFIARQRWSSITIALDNLFYGICEEMNVDSIGEAFATVLNRVFDGIDWNSIKNNVIAGVRRLSAEIKNFCETFDWDNLSETITGLIDTLASTVYEFITSEGFNELKDKLASAITDGINGIDYEQLGNTIGAVISKAFEFLFTIIDGLGGIKGISSKMLSVLKGAFEEVDKESLARVIGDIVIACLTLAIPKILVHGVTQYMGTKILTKAFSKAIAGKAVASTVTETVGGAIAETAGASSISATLASVGATIGGGLALAVGGAFGAWIGKYLAHGIGNLTDDEFYKNFSFFGDDGYGLFPAIKDMWDMKFNKTPFEEFASTLAKVKDGATYADEELKKLQDRYGWTDSQIKILKNTMEENASAFANVNERIKESNGELSSIKDSVYPAKESIRQFSDTASQSFTITSEKARVLAEQVKNDNSVKDYANRNKEALDGMQKNVNATNFDKVVESAIKMKQETSKQFTDTKTSAKVMYDSVNLETANCANTMKVKWNEISNTTKTSTNNVKASTKSLRECFTKDKWTFSGVIEGLKETFSRAISAIREKWNSFASKANSSGSSGFNLKLPTFATGGFPEEGPFMMNRGEIAGKFSNGKTVVANNEQIVDGIAEGVASANAEQNALLRQQNALLQGILEKETGISADAIFNSVQNSANNFKKRTGRYAFS